MQPEFTIDRRLFVDSNRQRAYGFVAGIPISLQVNDQCSRPSVLAMIFCSWQMETDHMFYRAILLALLISGAFVADATAQCSTGSGTTSLLINNTSAVGQALTIEVSADTQTSIKVEDSVGGGGHPFILAVGAGLSCQSIYLTWGGTLDITSPQILLNGMMPSNVLDMTAKTDWTYTYPTGCLWNGNTSAAIQAVCAEPTLPPFFVRETGAIQATYVASSAATTTYAAFSDDSFQSHSFIGNCGGSPVSIEFGGTAYTDIYFSSNGIVSFGASSTDYSPTAAEFFGGFGVGAPGVATRWYDYASSQSGSSSVKITEDSAAGSVEVQYIHMKSNHTGSNQGDWSCRFAPATGTGASGSGTMVTLDFTNSITDFISFQTYFIGVTDGVAGGTNTLLQLQSSNLPHATAAGAAPESILSTTPSNAAPTGVFTFTDVLGNHTWTVQ